MKKTVTLFTLLLSISLSAQHIKKQLTLDIPYLGSEGTYMLYWQMDYDKLKLYTYGHQKGVLVQKTDKEIAEIRKKQADKKTWFGKLFAPAVDGGGYTHRALIFRETVVSPELVEIRSKNYVVHNSNNQDPEVRKYFKPENNIHSINIFKENLGKETDFGTYQLHKEFPGIPQLNTTALSYYDATYEGDGTLGLKNYQPYLKYYRANYFYDHTQKGFETKTSEERGFPLNSLLGNKYVYEFDSFDYVDKDVMHAWFSKSGDDKKDKRIHEMVFFNAKKEIFNKVVFESPTSKKLLFSKEVRNANTNEIVGFASVFGYDKKAKKKYRGEDYSTFYVFLTDLKGNLIAKTEFEYGTKKNYKYILNPLAIYKTADHLIILNEKSVAMLKHPDIEVLKLDKTGSLTTLSTTPLKDLFPEVRTVANNFDDKLTSSSFTDGTKIFLTPDISVEKIKSGEFMGKETYEDITFYYGIHITTMNKNYSFKNHFFEIPKTDAKPKITALEDSDKIKSYIVRTGKNYTFISITPNTVKNIPIEIDNTEFDNDIYTTFYTEDDIIVDAKNRQAIVINQLFDKRATGKFLEKVLLTSITF